MRWIWTGSINCSVYDVFVPSRFELQIVAAVVLDLIWGDPGWFPHPVRFIGLLCTVFENISRSFFSSALLAGMVTVVAVLSTLCAGVCFILAGVYMLSPLAAQGAAVCFVYFSVAARDLAAHSGRVYAALEDDGSREKARAALALIVGRDTAALDESGIIRACVETVAENMVDGVTAPLFYAIVTAMFAPVAGVEPIFLAAVGAMCYKGVNTMDSMFGYKNERYLLFGRSAARLDDMINFIPARISSIFIVVAAFFLRLDWKNSYRVFLRDRLKHASPNAGHPEAAVAGALGVQLGGPSSYFGKIVRKPVIGTMSRDLEPRDIIRANSLMLLGAVLFFIFLFSAETD